MEKQASNTFVGGLNTDRHPLTAQPTELIDAKNIDLIAVGDGYQLILQKREGNKELLTYNQNTQQWEPAGLEEGFIPLAVREFNNVAYIISVNPDTLEGELGTFPSPDYDLFTYVKGAEIPGVANVGPNIYDPSAEAPEFGYTLSLGTDTGSITDTVLPTQPLNFVLIHSDATVTQVGYTPDSYSIALDDDDGGNIVIEYELSTNLGIWVTYDPLTPPVLNSPGQYVNFRTVIANPWITSDTILDTTVITTATITTGSGSASTNYTFNFTTPTIFEIKPDADPEASFTGLPIVPLPYDLNAHAGLKFSLRCNNPTSIALMSQAKEQWNPAPFDPSWITFQPLVKPTVPLTTKSTGYGKLEFDIDANGTTFTRQMRVVVTIPMIDLPSLTAEVHVEQQG